MQNQDITPTIVDESARWGALAKAGEAAAGASNLIIKADRFVKTTTAKMELDTELDKVKADFFTRTDYENFAKEYEEKAADIQKRYSEKYGDVWGQLQPFANNKIANAKIHVDYHGRKLWLDDARGKIATSVDVLHKQYAYADDPYLRQKKREEIETVLSNAVSTGIIGAAKKEETMMTLDNKADVYRVTTLIENDPEVALAYLNERNDSGGYKNFTALEPEQRGQYLRRARTTAESYRHDVERQRKEQERIAKEKVKEAQKATGDLFVERYVNGTLKETDILRSNLDPTGENSKEHWINKLRSKGNDPEGYKTDKVIETRLYSRIVRDPESVTDDEILNTIGKGLSQEDGKGLINERRTRLKEPQDPAEKAIYDNLSRDRKAGLFGTGPEGDLEYAKQVEAFKKWRKANMKEDPSVYYEKLTTPYKKGLIGTWLDFAWPDKADPKKRREEMAGTQAAPKGKSIVGYKNGKPVYDLGNGKWQVGD